MTEADVLTAIDDALDTGLATDDDALTRELQELALALRADSPEPTEGYSEWLDRQVEAGFPRKRSSGPAWWQRLLQPAAAVGMTAAAVLVIALATGGLSGSSGDDSAGSSAGSDAGGGGGMAEKAPAQNAGGGRVEHGVSPAVIEPKVTQRAAPGGDRAASGGDQALAASTPGSVIPLPRSNRGFAPGRTDRKIERTMALELEAPVDEMARVADQVTAVTYRHGGFVLSSSVSTGKDGAGGDFNLRIPANELRPALRDLSALADVRTQSQTGRDVTRAHVTARQRLRSARAERRSLLRRLEVATTDAEAEAIRRRLDIVAGEINGLRGRLHSLRLRTDYAVVTVSLLAKDDDGGASGGGGSFDDALHDAGDLLVGLAGVLVRVLAVALPLALLALLGWLATRAFRRRQRESALA
jgi:Domain of unknown function (DUF4349)